MTTITIERARLEELLGEYWEIAFEESGGVTPTGNKANRVLHEIRALFDVKQAEIARLKAEAEERLQNCAALVAENEQLRKDAERYRWLRKDPQFLGHSHAQIDFFMDTAMKEEP